MDFVSLLVLIIIKYLENKKKIVFEKYRHLDPLGKGIKESDIVKLLHSLDFHHIMK
jgi:hypothetical protein